MLTLLTFWNVSIPFYRMQRSTNVVQCVPARSDISVLYVVILYSLHHDGVAAVVRSVSVSVSACDDVSSVEPVKTNCAAAQVLKIPSQLLTSMHTKEMAFVNTTISQNSPPTKCTQNATERFIQPTDYSHIRRELSADNAW